jgi:hypothetical protein
MHEFAVVCLDALQIRVPAGLGVTDLCGGHARYVMYKAGPVLTVSVSDDIGKSDIFTSRFFLVLVVEDWIKLIFRPK